MILWAEDCEDDVLLMERAFKRAHLADCWIRVRDGDEATQYLAGVGRYADRDAYPLPEMLLLDIKMPRMSGLDVLRWTQARPELRALNAIILSSSEEARDIEEAYRLGAKGYLVKSARIEDLVRQLRNLHERWQGSVRLPEN